MQGRFYFGELLDDEYGCDEDVSAVCPEVEFFSCLSKGVTFVTLTCWPLSASLWVSGSSCW